MTFTDLTDFVEHAFRSGWTDGLPVFPAEQSLVQQALDTVKVDPDSVLWTSEDGPLSATDVAVFAIMAGCKTSYFPVVLAATQAFLDGLEEDALSLPTIAETSQCVIVNGPIRNHIEINCGLGLYGPGWRANATVGRAVRLVAQSILGPRTTSFGNPGQYTLCFGEDEENSQWTPLHAHRGKDVESSAVTVLSTLVQSLCADRHSTAPEALLDNLVSYARGKMSGSSWFGNDLCSLLLVIPPESRRVLGSWTKEAVYDYLYPRLIADDGTPIQPVRLGSPADLLIVAAGGPAFAAIQLFLAHHVTAVTKTV
jgi:hypothetical protein